MTVIVGASAHGSPGVSTALQLMASLWTADRGVPVILEADASGGVIAARYELSLTPGFVSLAESLRQFEAPPLLDHAQRLPSGVACVPLSPSATAASAQLRSAGPHLGSYLASCGHPVLVDVGTLLPDGRATATVKSAELLLWFVRPTREELLVLRHRLAECQQPERIAIVLVGSTPYNADQVEEALDVRVLHTLPLDGRAANAINLGGDDRFLRRSQLARSCSNLVNAITDQAWATAVPDAGPEGDGAPEPAPPASAPNVQERAAEPAEGDELVVWTNDSD